MAAVLAPHMVTPLHASDGCFQGCTAGVTEVFTGLEKRLLADNPFTNDLLNLYVGIGNDPVPVQKAAAIPPSFLIVMV